MRIPFLGVLLVFLSLGLAGQDVPVAEPHVTGVFYYLDPDTEGMLPLERLVATPVTRVKGWSGGRETALSMPGARSRVRLHAGKPGVFVFAVELGVNPYSYVQFFQLESRKDTREILQSETVNGRTADLLNRSQLPFRVMRHGTLSFKVVLQGPLAPGEYGLSTPTSNVGYCFGVD